jgi:hypothetical protein
MKSGSEILSFLGVLCHFCANCSLIEGAEMVLLSDMREYDISKHKLNTEVEHLLPRLLLCIYLLNPERN